VSGNAQAEALPLRSAIRLRRLPDTLLLGAAFGSPSSLGQGDMDKQRRRLYRAAALVLCALSGLLVLALIANWARTHNRLEIKSQQATTEKPIKAGQTLEASPTSRLSAGSAAASVAEADHSAMVTIFRGGTLSSIDASDSAESMARRGVTIFAGSRTIVVMPEEMAVLPGAALATGAGAGMSGGTVALSPR
jgi:hypothetical protein